MSDVVRYKWILGIDPSFGATGAVLLSSKGKYLDGIVCSSYSDWDRETRMFNIANDVMNLVGDRKGSVLVCLEDNHFTGGRSAQSALTQRELIGFLAGTVVQVLDCSVVRVAPTSAKKTMTGSGKSGKDAMVEVAARTIGGLTEAPKRSQEALADALAVALAGMEKISD